MTTLVAGATGYLGRFIVDELHRRGHRVRAIVRNRTRAELPGPWEAPALDGLVDEWIVGEVTDPSFTADVAEGADSIISALGVTRQKTDPWTVDYQANLNILNSAEKHKARRFCFVNVIGGDRCPAQLTKAKTAFARKLAASPIASQIVNPSGYFSDMIQILQMARRGRVFLFRPEVQTNPIHGADLAKFCVDRLEIGKEGEWNIGGPEIFAWRELANCAFRTLERPAKITTLSPTLSSFLIKALSLVKPRQADIARFVTWSMLHDCIGDPFGTHHLSDFYIRHAGSKTASYRDT